MASKNPIASQTERWLLKLLRYSEFDAIDTVLDSIEWGWLDNAGHFSAAWSCQTRAVWVTVSRPGCLRIERWETSVKHAGIEVLDAPAYLILGLLRDAAGWLRGDDAARETAA